MVNIANLDLNLLVSLDALLRERSVTRAAQRLGLSQPALSAALNRLRRHFGDPLLMRTGNTYQLSPLAVQLLERSSVALAGVELVFGAQAQFDPAQCRREFTLLVSDYVMTVLSTQIVDVLFEQAPHARVRFENHSTSMIDNAAERLRISDALVLPHGFLSDLPHLDLYRDRWVCLVSADNEEVGDRLTLQHLAELPWVLTWHAPTAYSPAARQMELLGISPQIQVVTDGFLPVPQLVAGSRRIALVQERLLGRLPAAVGVRAMECPFEAVPLVEALWWHPVSAGDPEHQFLRRVVAEASDRVAEVHPGSGIDGTDARARAK